MSDELPEGWASLSLGDLIHGFEAGRNLRAEGHPAADGEFGVLKISAVTWGDFRPQENKALLPEDEPRPHETVRRNDLLITRANTSDLVGAVVLVERDHPRLMLPDKILRLRLKTELVEPRFALQALRTRPVRDHFESNATGTSDSMRNLAQPKIAAAPVALAPLPEQRRIVTQVEALLEQVKRAKGRLDRVPLILKRFRQAVLAAACSGELTREWRETSDRPSSASALIEGAPLVDTDLPTVPEGWAWALMAQVAEIRGGIQKQPKRAPKKNAYPYLRVANVLRGRLNLDQMEQMELFGDEPETYRLKSGDILIVEGNGSLTEIGRSAVWHDEVPNCVHQNHIIRVRPGKCSSKFLDFYWNSPLGVSQVSAVAVTTSGLYSLSTKKIAGLPVPVAPLEEQREIVRQVDRLFAVADTIERRVEAATARADKLPQAILSKAFSGELVPTEAELARAEGRTYETAAELLKRVSASATTAGSGAKARRRGARRTG